MVDDSPNTHGRVALLMALRRHGIDDMAVLEAMEKMPRDVFVDEPFQYRRL